jgi:eukaryotic-like serine/threonine-protein kinase
MLPEVVPRSVGPWEIRSVIGRGGIGIVYRSVHRRTGRAAAVKLLGPAPVVDPRAARRLAREFEVLRSLDHPNVVRVYEAGVFEGYSYLAMELVEGLDLRAFLSPTLDEASRSSPPSDPSVYSLSAVGISEVGPDAIRSLAALMEEPDTAPAEFHPPVPAPPGAEGRSSARPPLGPEAQAGLNRPVRMDRLLNALTQVLGALAYVHGRGLVHRDLKPSNIMVDDQRQARIMDFGLVKHPEDVADPLTGHGRVVGTYRYMAPEQAQGQVVDGRADLYSLGVILYELLAASPPFVSQDPAVLWHEILHELPVPLAEVNPGADPTLSAIAARCLEKNPEARFSSAEDILEVLARRG